MLSLPPALQAALNSGVTTLAWCWIVTRVDGVQLGFTDHDLPLEIAGIACEPGSGLSPAPLRSETGTPARGAAFGALASDRISDSDLANGLYQSARVEVWRVDWRDPASRVRVFTGEMGEVRKAGARFEVELAGLSARLNRRIGRVFAKTCDAELGDARCGVDLNASAYRAEASVSEVITSGQFIATGLTGFAPGWFMGGVLRWITGGNAGAVTRLASHEITGAAVRLVLASPPPHPAMAGDSFEITAGCDGRAQTCQERFGNFARFRGCPHLPGNDVLVRHAGSEPVRDGGRR